MIILCSSSHSGPGVPYGDSYPQVVALAASYEDGHYDRGAVCLAVHAIEDQSRAATATLAQRTFVPDPYHSILGGQVGVKWGPPELMSTEESVGKSLGKYGVAPDIIGRVSFGAAECVIMENVREGTHFLLGGQHEDMSAIAKKRSFLG